MCISERIAEISVVDGDSHRAMVRDGHHALTINPDRFEFARKIEEITDVRISRVNSAGLCGQITAW